MAESLLCIAIDFGTAYSGYSVKSNDRGIGGSFQAVVWGQEFSTRSCKTPTCILFDKNEEFVAFGYPAMQQYTSGFLQGYFFENFKMELYRNTNIQRNFEISAVNGGQMKAITVISESLKYLKNHALEKINNFSKSVKLQESDITWVLTVPAIWDNAAKQFMREAAKQAGLVTDADPDKLIMALEPEAAAIYCKELSGDGFVGGTEATKLEQELGTQYMTVDCGGGTIDITVHEVLARGSLKQVDQASGHGLGGQNIDKEFKSLLQRICGLACWEEYEKQHANELQKIMYDFAIAKCAKENNGFRIPCSLNLSETVKTCTGVDMETLLQRVPGVSWTNRHIVISPEKLESFFLNSLSSTTKLLNDIMRKPGLHIKYMLLVGGYAMCKILQDFIKVEFSSECTILCPQNPQEAVMVGAAIFGSQPQVVKSRICPLTYGIEVAAPFDGSNHKAEKKYFTDDGEAYCSDLFHRLVKRNESVGFDEIRHYQFYPVSRTQTAVRFQFFSTTKDDSKYVDDWGMTNIPADPIIIPMPNNQGDRKIDLEVKFGCTEITATAVNSKHTGKLTINFMSE